MTGAYGEHGSLVVISGFSGAGKGTIMKKLLSEYPSYCLSISATSRAPRPGEEDGREYFFRTKEEFQEMIRRGELLEYTRYLDNYYGTPLAYVDEKRKEGMDVLLEIETDGALKVKKEFPEVVLVFVVPPDPEELYSRLKTRGTESEEIIQRRMKQALDEANLASSYDYLLVNDNLEECTERLHRIIQTTHHRMANHLDFMKEFHNALDSKLKGEFQ